SNYERQQVNHVIEGYRDAVAAGQILDREIERLEQKSAADGQHHAFQLTAAIELSGQQAGERDHRKAESGQWYRQPLIGFDDKGLAQHRIEIGRRKQQLAEKPLLRLAVVGVRRVAQRVEVEDPALKGQHRQFSGVAVVLLTV